MEVVIVVEIEQARMYNIYENTKPELPEDDAGASKHVGVLTIYKIKYIYIYTHTRNKPYKIHGTYNKIKSQYLLPSIVTFRGLYKNLFLDVINFDNAFSLGI